MASIPGVPKMKKLPLVGGGAPMRKLPGAGPVVVKPIEPNKPVGPIRTDAAMGFKRRRPRAGLKLPNTGVGGLDMAVKTPGPGGRF
jgi:hypothetical protein